jgi:hypothetical protein
MKQKRLQHVADTVCHMFCGWRLNFSVRRLVDLGSGQLRVDLITGRTSHNGAAVDDLPIVRDLMSWMGEDLKGNGMEVSDLETAELTVDLDLTTVPWEETSSQFFSAGREIRTDSMHRCKMQCASVIRTQDRSYESQYVETKHWPEGWPEQ